MKTMDDRPGNGILFDHGRKKRIGMPEAIFCEGKSREALEALLLEHGNSSPHPALFTRLSPSVFYGFAEHVQRQVGYHELSQTAFAAPVASVPVGNVALLSAGTADGKVTWEAARTLAYLGIRHNIFEDNGVAGLWRLLSNIESIDGHDVIIVVAGFDAALASVMGGLSSRPVIAVPTSVGYGMARNGQSALSSMLVSCAPGLTVVNIDNGFGGACAAARIINLLQDRMPEIRENNGHNA